MREEGAAAGEHVVAVEGAAGVGRRQQALAAALAARLGEDRRAAGQTRERAPGADHETAGREVAAAGHGLAARGRVEVRQLTGVALHAR